MTREIVEREGSISLELSPKEAMYLMSATAHTYGAYGIYRELLLALRELGHAENEIHDFRAEFSPSVKNLIRP